MYGIYYVTLVGPLRGYCIAISARSEAEVREYCKNNLGRVWCSVYTEPPTEKLLNTYEL